ncbi:hypothetical protein AGABI2DRAFT_121497 [Agaricus bisporus var. bisporus H97]|uniref:hypothetical protein n=1 Tax=Agaricus bisporus var. bisporus (strain H97 / ATCC MYA-4626 / FGSC 10389) TaxID=936046 RepID=UPI00029F6D3A|nr:hypothetical protein AGABI2DRAFT_121497 [Agaricus bisporus var. bisporus H97]EKV43371.1 hypothetical protein AGABI2DRAFT_121497 [Agaricus bisporus var. bisporus H97]
MSSTLAIQTEASSKDRFCPVWLKSIFENLRNATVSVYYVVEFLDNWTFVTITLGIPYLQYQLYKNDEDGETGTTEKYSKMIKSLDTLWDHYSDFLFHILPILFPMVATSGVPLCSSASFAATMTFTIGTVSIATRMIFKVKAKTLQTERAINEWKRASATSWCQVPNKSFWVLLSLPNVVFFLSIGLLISTVILTFWERRSVVDPDLDLGMQGCPLTKLEVFKYTLVVTFAATVSHFTFIIIKLRSLTTLQPSESAAAV